MREPIELGKKEALHLMELRFVAESSANAAMAAQSAWEKAVADLCTAHNIQLGTTHKLDLSNGTFVPKPEEAKKES